jgi:DNA (cytosine-5)-methyltransferase 1
MLTFGSLFAGIGGFDLAFERAGMRCLWQVEVDPFCGKVLQKHGPTVRRYGDVRNINPDELEPVDLLCGGVPCQDWSVAGRRAGLAGERSRLFFDFARLADALTPRFVVFENVPGLLSTHKGEDFATVLEYLTGCRPAVPREGWRNSGFGYGPKRSVAWRILDAQHFRIPQRRRRIFLIADSRRGADPAEILFEPEGCPGDTPPRRETGADVARCLGASTGGVSGKEQQVTFIPVARCLTADNQRIDGDTETFVIQDVRGGTRDRTDHGQGIGIRQGGPMYTLGAVEQHAVAYQCHGGNVGPMGTLRQGSGGLTGGVPFLAHTLCAEGHDASEDGTGRGVPLVPMAFTERTRAQGRTVEWQANLAYALTNPGSGGRTHSRLIFDTSMAVRLLTPKECERLQGFPDGWTCLCEAEGDTMTCRCPDSPRYRALGNAVAVPVVEWIGRRIVAIAEGVPDNVAG